MKAVALMPVNVNGGAMLCQADYHTSTHTHDWSFHHPSAEVCRCLAKSNPAPSTDFIYNAMAGTGHVLWSC